MPARSRGMVWVMLALLVACVSADYTKQVGVLNVGDEVMGLAAHKDIVSAGNSYLYLAGGTTGLIVLDVSNNAPTVAHIEAIIGGAHHIVRTVSGLLAVFSETEMHLFDPSASNTAPPNVGSYSISGVTAATVDETGEVVYVAGCEVAFCFVKAVSVSDPQNPAVLGWADGLNLPLANFGGAAAVYNRHLFVAGSGAEGVRVYSTVAMSLGTAVAAVSTLAVPSLTIVSALSAVGGKLYIAGDTFATADLAVTSAPTLLVADFSVVPSKAPGSLRYVSVVNGAAHFCVNGEAEVEVVGVQGVVPEALYSMAIGASCRDVRPIGDVMYVAAGQALEIYLEVPRTEVPDTAAPPTPAPPTAVPTVAPPTPAPVTEVPRTEVPPTDAPATDAPATEVPGTVSPATPAPQTEAPLTDAPATTAPDTDVPSTDAPETVAPTAAPATDAPLTEAPLTDAPRTDVPLTTAPLTDAPATLPPRTEVPSTEAPETEVPATVVPDTSVPTFVPTEVPAVPTAVPTVVPTAVPAVPTTAPETTPAPTSTPVVKSTFVPQVTSAPPSLAPAQTTVVPMTLVADAEMRPEQVRSGLRIAVVPGGAGGAGGAGINAVPGPLAVKLEHPGGSFIAAQGRSCGRFGDPCVVLKTHMSPSDLEHGFAANAATGDFVTAEVCTPPPPPPHPHTTPQVTSDGSVEIAVGRTEGYWFNPPSEDKLEVFVASSIATSADSNTGCGAHTVDANEVNPALEQSMNCTCVGCNAAFTLHNEAPEPVVSAADAQAMAAQKDAVTVVIFASAAVGPMVSMAAGGHLVKLSVLTRLCPSQGRIKLDRTLNPLGLQLGEDDRTKEINGALVAGIAIQMALVLCSFLVASVLACRLSKKRAAARLASEDLLNEDIEGKTKVEKVYLQGVRKSDTQYLLARSRFGWIVMPSSFLFGGASMSCASALMYSSAPFKLLAAADMVIFLGGMVYFCVWSSRSAHKYCSLVPFEVPEKGRPWYHICFWGHEEYVPHRTSVAAIWSELHHIVYDCYQNRSKYFLTFELLTSFLIGAIAGWHPPTKTWCWTKSGLMQGVLVVHFIALLTMRPYLPYFENIMETAIVAAEIVALSFVLLAMGDDAHRPGTSMASLYATKTALLVMYMISFKALVDMIVFIIDEYIVWKELREDPEGVSHIRSSFILHILCCGNSMRGQRLRDHVTYETTNVDLALADMDFDGSLAKDSYMGVEEVASLSSGTLSPRSNLSPRHLLAEEGVLCEVAYDRPAGRYGGRGGGLGDMPRNGSAALLNDTANSMRTPLRSDSNLSVFSPNLRVRRGSVSSTSTDRIEPPRRPKRMNSIFKSPPQAYDEEVLAPEIPLSKRRSRANLIDLRDHIPEQKNPFDEFPTPLGADHSSTSPLVNVSTPESEEGQDSPVEQSNSQEHPLLKRGQRAQSFVLGNAAVPTRKPGEGSVTSNDAIPVPHKRLARRHSAMVAKDSPGSDAGAPPLPPTVDPLKRTQTMLPPRKAAGMTKNSFTITPPEEEEVVITPDFEGFIDSDGFEKVPYLTPARYRKRKKKKPEAAPLARTGSTKSFLGADNVEEEQGALNDSTAGRRMTRRRSSCKNGWLRGDNSPLGGSAKEDTGGAPPLPPHTTAQRRTPVGDAREGAGTTSLQRGGRTSSFVRGNSSFGGIPRSASVSSAVEVRL